MKKQPWPKIKPVEKNGKSMLVVDARIKGKGERRYFDTKGEAEGWAQQQRVRRVNEGVSGATIPERLRVEAVECQGRLEPHNATLSQAVDFFLKHAKPAGGHRKIAVLVDEFIAAKRRAGRRDEYLRVQSSVLGLFSKAYPEAHAHEITGADVEKWLDTRGASLRTRRNYQNDIRNLFGYAVKHGYAAGNPVDRLEKITLDDKAVEILTVKQAGALLGAAEAGGGVMTPFIAIGLFAGLRTREIAALDWKDVSLGQKTIIVQAAKTKTRARRVVPMSDNLAAWLKRYAQEAGPVTPEAYRTAFEVVREKARISPWPRNAMRHSAASYHLAHHNNEGLTQAMLGHESGKMLIQHYRELVMPVNAVKYWKVMPPERAGNVVSMSEAA